MPLVEPGMKTVFPEMSMTRSSSLSPGGCRDRSSGDRRSLDPSPAPGDNRRMDRATLAEFLRNRREALLPEDVGLPAGPRRRTRGLRREEVASLAVMSTDYYTRVEETELVVAVPAAGAFAGRTEVSADELVGAPRIAPPRPVPSRCSASGRGCRDGRASPTGPATG